MRSSKVISQLKGDIPDPIDLSRTVLLQNGAASRAAPEAAPVAAPRAAPKVKAPAPAPVRAAKVLDDFELPESIAQKDTSAADALAKAQAARAALQAEQRAAFAEAERKKREREEVKVKKAAKVRVIREKQQHAFGYLLAVVYSKDDSGSDSAVTGLVTSPRY